MSIEIKQKNKIKRRIFQQNQWSQLGINLKILDVLASFIEESSQKQKSNMLFCFNVTLLFIILDFNQNKMSISKVIDLSNVSIQDECGFDAQKSENHKMRSENEAKKRKKTYQWTDEQNKKYYCFLRALKQMNAIEHKRVKIRNINIRMSAHIRTRTSNQCRSHHQKMLCRFGNNENIISHFQTYFLRKDSILDHIYESNESQQATPSIKNCFVEVLEQQNHILNWPITSWDLEYALQGNPGIQIIYQ